MKITPGQIVISKCGRDKGKAFIVFKLSDENYNIFNNAELSQFDYVFIADGKIRKIENLKKKKIKHIELTDKVDFNIKAMLENKENIKNADIVKALHTYRNGGI